MKERVDHGKFCVCVIFMAIATLVGYGHAHQVPLPKTAAEVPGNAAGNAMTTEYVQMVGRMAYVWGYPMVNSHNRRIAFSKAPEPVLVGGVLPFAPGGYNAMVTNYIAPNQTFICLPQSGRGVWSGFFRVGEGADGSSGAGFWRPLLGSCAV